MTKRKTSEYVYTNKEVMEMARAEFHIDLPIRKDKKEKRDYIVEEIEMMQEMKPVYITEYDKLRYEMLLKFI